MGGLPADGQKKNFSTAEKFKMRKKETTNPQQKRLQTASSVLRASF